MVSRFQSITVLLNFNTRCEKKHSAITTESTQAGKPTRQNLRELKMNVRSNLLGMLEDQAEKEEAFEIGRRAYEDWNEHKANARVRTVMRKSGGRLPVPGYIGMCSECGQLVESQEKFSRHFQAAGHRVANLITQGTVRSKPCEPGCDYPIGSKSKNCVYPMCDSDWVRQQKQKFMPSSPSGKFI